MHLIAKVTGVRLFFGFWMLQIFSSSHASPLVSCKENPYLQDITQAYLLRGGNHDSIFLLPDKFGNLPTRKDIDQQFVRITEEVLYGSQDYCPKKAPNGLFHPSQQNSTCPWYYIKTIDENRYPSEMWETKCSCSSCLDFLNTTQTKNPCKPVYYHIKVLRRVACNIWGFYDYLETLEPIRVGCTCSSLKPNYSSDPEETPIITP